MVAFDRKRLQNLDSVAEDLVAMGSRVLIIAAVFLVVGIAAGQPPIVDRPSPESMRLYRQWVAALEAESPPIPQDPENPLYLQLRGAPDADLVFLEGLRHPNYAVRSLSSRGLAYLQTERSFQVLTDQLQCGDVSERGKALSVLGSFRVPRCVPHILRVLRDDPEAHLRAQAAEILGSFEGEEVVRALLDALKDEEPVATMAVRSLARLRVPEAIDPTFDLFLRSPKFRHYAHDALCWHHHKRSVTLLLQGLEEISKIAPGEFDRCFASTDRCLAQYAGLTMKEFGPLPETFEQWKVWWTECASLFTDTMERVPPPPEPAPEEYAVNPALARFSIALDASTYRIGDPIRLELQWTNESDLPYRTIPPRGRRMPRVHAIKLERLTPDAATLIDVKADGAYVGSYAGPPPFETVRPRETFRHRLCLQDFVRRLSLWPLPEGRYRLTLSYQSLKFPGVRPKPWECVGEWAGDPVEFSVEGAPITDPEELLSMIAAKSGSRWLRADLTSKRHDRAEAARRIVSDYGDTRLVRLFENLGIPIPWGIREFAPENR